MTDNKIVTLKDTLKSPDTEEWLDLFFYRKIGYAWALLFRRLTIKPNTVTIASIFIGASAGIFFYYDNLLYNFVGMFLLVWANSLDSADGQLARMTGQYSRLGRILDGMSGDIWFIIIYFAVVYRLRDFEGWSWWVYPFGIVAGYSHITQAAIADCYRNMHLFFINGRKKSELDEVEPLTDMSRTITWRSNFIKKLLLLFYINYTRSQQLFSPAMRKMRKDINTLYPNCDVPAELSHKFIKMSKPLLKYTNILTFNTRIIALFVSLAINEVWLYYLFEITILNVVLVYMVVKYERVCRKFDAILNLN
ncbi:MAG: CDP-alcohol phosphatidyltransferase family protein [Bacteroidales bacterium]